MSSGRSKQDELDLLCDQLGLQRMLIGVGSSIPSDVFSELTGLKWEPAFDSRGTISGGGSTVTRDGLARVNRAVAVLLA